jgi:hypothetical protein
LSYLHRLWPYRGLGRRRCGDPQEPGNVVKPELVAPGQRMVGGQHEHARLLADLLEAEAGSGDRRADEGDIGATVKQAGRRLGQLEGGATGR